jgi:hypothetical protein
MSKFIQKQHYNVEAVSNMHEDRSCCVQCNQMKEVARMVIIFKTGFKRVDGLDYHLGICMDCQNTGLKQVG